MSSASANRSPPLRAALILLFAAALLTLGVVFIARPDWGAPLFGLRLGDDTDDGFVRALGIRDVALSFFLAGLVLFGDRRAQGVVLAGTAFIPASDLVLVAIQAGAPPSLLLHGASAGLSLLLAFWTLRR